MNGQRDLVLLSGLPDCNTGGCKDSQDGTNRLDPGGEFSAREFGGDAEDVHEFGRAQKVGLCCLTFELTGRRRRDASARLAKMYRVPPAGRWWHAVGAPVERGVRPQFLALQLGGLVGHLFDHRLRALAARQAAQEQARRFQCPPGPTRKPYSRIGPVLPSALHFPV